MTADLTGATDEYLARQHYVLKERCTHIARALNETRRKAEALERRLAKENEKLIQVDLERACR